MLLGMRVKRYVLVSSAVLAVGAGTGGAIAATRADDGKKAEQSILADAAKRLNVSPDALRSALGAAEAAQLDQAVKDGKLTQAQADAIKARRQQSGRVLGGPGGPDGRHGFGPGGPGFGHGARGGLLDAAATALGLKPADLLTKLRAGKSVADVAKDQGRTVADVKTAVTDAVTKQLDADVQAGRITAAQRTAELDELSSHLDELLSATPGTLHRGRAAGHPRRWR
jgi:hypothetical protein